jgi:O-antigen/teichoic acid export membrane protein
MGARTVKNTALILTARVLSRTLALASVSIMIWHLGEARLGQFQDVVNLSGLATVFLDLGFNTLFQREAAKHPDQLSQYLSRLVTGRLFAAIPALLVFAGFLTLSGKQEFLLPAFAAMVLASYSGLLRGSLYALQRLRLEAVAIVLETAVLLGLVGYGVLTGQGVEYFLWAYAAQYGFSCVYFTVVLTLGRIARIRWALDPVFMVNWLFKGLPFAATFVITTIYFKMNVPILDALKGDAQAGIFTAAYKPFEALLFIPVSMLNVVFPVLAVYHKGAGGQLSLAVNRFYKSLLLLGWPIGVGVFMLAEPLRFLYSYPAATRPLRVLALGILVMFTTNAFAGALNAIDRQLTFTWAALVSMLLNLALNLALIPPFGYMGAAWATVLTEVALFGMGWYLTGRHLARVPVISLSWRIVIAGLVMGAALYPLQHIRAMMLPLAILAGAVVYGLSLLLLGGLDRDELGILRRAVSQ